MRQVKLSSVVAGLALGAGLMAAATMPDAARAAGKSGPQKVQKVTVTIDGGYKPATVSVKAGLPVQLTFFSKGASCANTVNIPALKKTLALKTGQKKTLTFTPKKGQNLAFACGMGMYKGRIVAK